MSLMTEHNKLLTKEFERLDLLVEFDDKIFNAQIDIIISKLSNMKRVSKPKIDDVQSVKSWADQMEEEEKEQLAAKDFPKLSKDDKPKRPDWTTVVSKSKISPPNVVFNFEQLFDYPFFQPMKANHHVNFHCNTYHWVTRWFEETSILVKTEKFIKFFLEMKDNRVFLIFNVNEKSKSVKLSLFDQIFTCYDQDDRPYEMKVKLIKDYIV